MPLTTTPQTFEPINLNFPKSTLDSRFETFNGGWDRVIALSLLPPAVGNRSPGRKAHEFLYRSNGGQTFPTGRPACGKRGDEQHQDKRHQHVLQALGNRHAGVRTCREYRDGNETDIEKHAERASGGPALKEPDYEPEHRRDQQSPRKTEIEISCADQTETFPNSPTVRVWEECFVENLN